MSTQSNPEPVQPLVSAPEIIPSLEYEMIQAAYDHFNRGLFEGTLPRPMFTITRGQKRFGVSYRGYFARDRFNSRSGEETVHEIALNPDHFKNVSDEDILSTLAHEMVHLWQREFGVETTFIPHNAEWANKMESIGLLPTATGRPGGERTGRTVTHCVIEGGQFQKSAEQFLSCNYLSWQDRCNIGVFHSQISDRRAKRKLRMEFECPRCGQKVITEAPFHLICDCCERVMTRKRPLEGEQIPPVLFIVKATRDSNYAMAERLFQYCRDIYSEKATQFFRIAEGVATGIPDDQGPGWDLRKHAARWIADFLKDKERGAQLRLFEEMLKGDDVKAALEVVLPTLNLNARREPDARLIREMAECEEIRVRAAALQLQASPESETN